MSKISEFDCLVFDVYGTLVDWESGIWNGLQPLLKEKSVGREGALRQFVRLEAAIQQEFPNMLYKDVLGRVYGLLADGWKVGNAPGAEECQAFSQTIETWLPFPDTVSALNTLSKHFKLVVLSNVDRDIFEVTRQKLERGFQFDRVCTAQDIGTYKPDTNNLEYALKAIKEDFGIDRENVLVTAQSLYHDHAPANKLGLKSAWIARDGAVMGDDGSAAYNFRFGTLGEMAAALGR